MSIANHPTGAGENAAQRRARAFELRTQGQSYRAIGLALGISYEQARKDCARVMDRLGAAEGPAAEGYRALELEKLDLAETAISAHVISGRLDAIDRWLRIAERRAKLLGLDAPTKVAPTDPTGENPYASASDEHLRRDLLRLVTALTGTDGATDRSGALSLEPDRSDEPAAPAG